MQNNIIVKPSTEQQFDRFLRQGRALFFSAPCGFGKTAVAEALLSGREVLRLSADSADFSLPSAEADWQILLLDDLQDMQEEQDWNALCELIRACPERRFVLLSRGTPPGSLMAFQYTGLMTVLEADDLLFDADDVRRLLRLYGVEAADSEIDGILKESVGYPLGVAITARCMSPGKPWTPELVARVFREVFLYFETAIYRRFDLPVRRFLLELAPFESFDLEMADGQRRSPCRRTAGLASSIHHYAALRQLPALPLLVGFPSFSPLGDGAGIHRGKAPRAA